MLITHREINLAIIPELLRRRTMLSENNRGSRLRCYTVDDQQAIRQLIENWVLWRDTGEWERLATLWHPEGRMITTWNQSGAAEFISRSRRAWENGIQVLHAM
ncbi:MAG TPA: nuclear transport factor 2 family protein, partial [Steroidobacteraceae bacterium]